MNRRHLLNTSNLSGVSNSSTTSAAATSTTGMTSGGVSSSTNLVTPKTPSSKLKPFSTPGALTNSNNNSSSNLISAASPIPTPQQKKGIPLLAEKGSKNSAPSTPRCSSPTIDSNINIGRTGELINTFKNVFKQGDVNCVCYVEKTGSIWTGGSEGQFCIYDVKSNLNNLDFRRVSTNGPLNEISKLTFTAMTVVKSFSKQVDCTVWTGFSNGKIIIWDAVTINKVFEFDCHSATVTQILCIVNTITSKRYIWTSSMDRTIRILDADTFQPIQILSEQSPIVGMVYLEKFNQVWILSDDGQIKIRDSIDGKIVKDMPSMINSKQIINSGLNIWTCNSEGKLRIWDCEKMKCIKEIKAHESTINKILATNKQVWSCGDDKVIHIFESSTLKAIKKIKANSVSVVDMIELPNQRIFAFCSDNKVRIWECEGEPLASPEPKTNLQSDVEPTTHVQSTTTPVIEVSPTISTTFSTTNSTTPTTTPTHSQQSVINQQPPTSNNIPNTIGSLLTNSTTSPTKREDSPKKPITSQIPTPQTPPQTAPITESKSVVPQPKAKPKFTRGVSMDLAKIIGNDHYDFLKSNIIIDKNELSLEDHKEHKEEIEYESSSEEDEDNDSIKAMKEAYEREIVMLRKQLQEASSRIPKYKVKLRSKTDRLDSKELELIEARTLIRNLEEKEEFHKHEYDASKQLYSEEKSKMLEDRKEIFNKLKSIYYSLSLTPSKEIEEIFAQDHEMISIVDLLDNIFVKLELERSNQEKEIQRNHQDRLASIKEGTEEVSSKLDILKRDNILLEDDSFFNEEDLSETSVMV
ncbi:predicted protein [Naegleria gruberi]|uniref:Predicted protein n=1 Tax=Naegleria gruberi TaxID=5762 RepID=D2VH78_NAEGR|nr:uncharacterized protein NAEGRDRAFT_68304 [Naegleria gruberi]EFC43932.1 predicted protein [Naegleria gruberi]|eukprot:XP_002676676.1 predicted protein [Naegleria gruberi strain NEG-M]